MNHGTLELVEVDDTAVYVQYRSPATTCYRRFRLLNQIVTSDLKSAWTTHNRVLDKPKPNYFASAESSPTPTTSPMSPTYYATKL
ncbi:hypothetical protein J6590_049432 [Homalodisca vitripennis]|nr:hypothetical protein J6590_049432 [Homalodisca vitripennis]